MVVYSKQKLLFLKNKNTYVYMHLLSSCFTSVIKYLWVYLHDHVENKQHIKQSQVKVQGEHATTERVRYRSLRP